MLREHKQAFHLGELTSTERALGKLRSLHRAQFSTSWAPWFSKTLATICWEGKHMQQTHPSFPRTAFWENLQKRWRCNWGRINPQKDLEAKEGHHVDHKLCQRHKIWRHPACLQCHSMAFTSYSTAGGKGPLCTGEDTQRVLYGYFRGLSRSENPAQSPHLYCSLPAYPTKLKHFWNTNGETCLIVAAALRIS